MNFFKYGSKLSKIKKINYSNKNNHIISVSRLNINLLAKMCFSNFPDDFGKGENSDGIKSYNKTRKFNKNFNGNEIEDENIGRKFKNSFFKQKHNSNFENFEPGQNTNTNDDNISDNQFSKNFDTKKKKFSFDLNYSNNNSSHSNSFHSNSHSHSRPRSYRKIIILI